MRPSVINNSTNKFTQHTARAQPCSACGSRAGAGWAGPAQSQANQGSGEGGGGWSGGLHRSSPRLVSPAPPRPGSPGPPRTWGPPSHEISPGKGDTTPNTWNGPGCEHQKPPFLSSLLKKVLLAAEKRALEPKLGTGVWAALLWPRFPLICKETRIPT